MGAGAARALHVGAAYGPDHPEVARTLGNLGLVARDQGDLAEARRAWSGARDLPQIPGGGASRHGQPRNNLRLLDQPTPKPVPEPTPTPDWRPDDQVLARRSRGPSSPSPGTTTSTGSGSSSSPPGSWPTGWRSRSTAGTPRREARSRRSWSGRCARTTSGSPSAPRSSRRSRTDGRRGGVRGRHHDGGGVHGHGPGEVHPRAAARLVEGRGPVVAARVLLHRPEAEPYSEADYEDLLRTLHGARETAPTPGPRPDFGPRPSGPATGTPSNP